MDDELDTELDASIANAGDTVPKAEHVRRINALKGKAKELRDAKARIAVLEKGAAEHETTVKERDNLRSQLANHERRGPLAAAGITDAEDQDMVLARYDRLPENERPPLIKWLAKDAREDRIAAKFLPTQSDAKGSDAKGSDTKGSDGKVGAPKPTGEGGAGGDNAPKYTPESVSKMSLADRKKHHAEIMAAFRA